jgi:hypothetical protein
MILTARADPIGEECDMHLIAPLGMARQCSARAEDLIVRMRDHS